MGCSSSTELQNERVVRAHVVSQTVGPKALLDALYYRDFQTTRQLLRRSDALRFVEYNDSILCEACQGNAPIDIVRAIYTFSSRQALHKNRYGLTPLHYSCFAPIESDQVRNFLLNVAPQAAQMPDNSDHLPLHAAIRSRKKAKFIKKLLLAYPEAISISAQDCNTPFQLFLKTWEDKLEKIWCRHGNFLHVPHDHRDYERIEMAKKVFLVLIEMKTDKTITERKMNLNYSKKWMPLLEILQAKGIPPIFSQLLTELIPSERTKQDDRGNFPLHLALQEPHVYHRLINFICHTNPQTAVKLDQNGLSCMALAIKNGGEWDLVSNVHMAAPDSIYIRDTVSKMYPFMLALCSPLSTINVAYELLRLDPSVLKCE